MGAFQREHCKTAQSQRDFSVGLRRRQAGFLADLLDVVRTDADWKNGEAIRLETLLWGGDEIVWVTPAWRGWRLLTMFYESAKAWQLLGKSVTHSAGLVFCHHKAPIHEIVHLAKELNGMVKEKGRRQKARNLFAYQVLESFDHIGRALDDDFLRRNAIRFSGTG